MNWFCKHSSFIALSVALVSQALYATETYSDINPDTGFRIDRYRAPVPDSVPGGTTVNAEFVRERQLAGDLLLIDVLPPKGLGADPFDGHWLLTEPRYSLKGAHWLPEVGRGSLSEEHHDYFERNLSRLTENDKSRPMVFFCGADCWQSWNAAKRAADWGYSNVHWFPEGTDGWAEQQLPLVQVAPINFLDDTLPLLLPSEASVYLLDPSGVELRIGSIAFEQQVDDSATFNWEIDTTQFKEHTLSERSYHCLTQADQYVCHLPQGNTDNNISDGNLRNLEQQLLFFTLPVDSQTIDAHAGAYYQLSIADDGTITGELMQGDLSSMSSASSDSPAELELNNFSTTSNNTTHFPSLVIHE